MKIVLNLDPDVLNLLARVRRARPGTISAVLNQALRNGLEAMLTSKKSRAEFRTNSRNAGALLIGDIDNVVESLVEAEGPKFRQIAAEIAMSGG